MLRINILARVLREPLNFVVFELEEVSEKSSVCKLFSEIEQIFDEEINVKFLDVIGMILVGVGI